MKEVLSFFTFGIGALCFVAFLAAFKPLAVTAAAGLANPAYCSTRGADAGRGIGWADDVCAHRPHGALNRYVERVFDPSRKDRHWGGRKLARDQ